MGSVLHEMIGSFSHAMTFLVAMDVIYNACISLRKSYRVIVNGVYEGLKSLQSLRTEHSKVLESICDMGKNIEGIRELSDMGAVVWAHDDLFDTTGEIYNWTLGSRLQLAPPPRTFAQRVNNPEVQPVSELIGCQSQEFCDAAYECICDRPTRHFRTSREMEEAVRIVIIW